MRAVSHDADGQVRRLAMRAASAGAGGPTPPDRDAARAVLAAGRVDDSPAVRVEALRSLRARSDDDSCDAALSAADDCDMHVALTGVGSARRLRSGAGGGGGAGNASSPTCPMRHPCAAGT